MNIGGLSPQVWISIVVILAAAALALVVDFLKRRNEELRLAMAKMQALRDHENKHANYDRMRIAGDLSGDKHKATKPEPPETERAAVPKQKDFIASAAERAAAKIAAEQIPAPTESAAPVDAVAPALNEPPGQLSKDVASKELAKEALSEWLAKRAAAAKPAIEAGPAREVVPAPEAVPASEVAPASEAEPESAPAISVTEPANAEVPVQPDAVAEIPAPAPEPIAAESQPVDPPKPDGPQVVIDDALLEAIFGPSIKAAELRLPATTASPAPAPRFQVIEGANGIPAGMNDRAALDRLLDANKTFSGLAFALGIFQKERRAGADATLSVYHFVRNLLRDDEFACQSAADEFVLLSPAEQRTDAKRRLTEISEQLWDFQLRGIGDYSIQFSWGDAIGIEEPLDDVVALANERMIQSRRVRKTVSFEPLAAPRMKAAI